MRTLTCAPLHCALRLHVSEFFLQRLHTLRKQPPVGLELRFTRAAQTNATLLPFQMGPAAHEPRCKMLELRKLHLDFTFVAARALREDIEYETGAVYDTAVQALLEVALLHRRKLVVENGERGARCCDRL